MSIGPEREEVMMDWRKYHSEELHDCTSHHTLLGWCMSEGEEIFMLGFGGET
jgi:hypothetical protein